MYNQCSNIVLNINIPLKIATRFHGRTKNKYNPTITYYIKEYIATHAILFKLKLLYSLIL